MLVDGTVGCGAITSTGAIADGAASTFTTGTTIGNLTLADGSITDSGGTISLNDENLTTTGDGTFDELTLTNSSQDWMSTGSFAALALQAQDSATAARFQLYSKDGDGTDSVNLRVYGEGTSSSVANGSWLQIGYSPSDYHYVIALKAGSGTDLPLYLGTNSYIDQIVLGIDGSTRLGDGATNYTEISPTGDIKPVGSAFIVIEKASGNGIKVDHTTPTFGFADLLGDQ
ncbi:hypothetical protein LCGC14_1941160, partial [marine sediment metagenome]